MAKRAHTTRHKSLGIVDKLTQSIRTTPASIMQPRIVFGIAVAFLIVFGMIMVYSSSFAMGIASSTQDGSAYIVRQLLALCLGLIALAVFYHLDYHIFASKQVMLALFIISSGLLLVVRFMGSSSHGASRWFQIGPLTFQPAEFIKLFVILSCAVLCYQYKVKYSMTHRAFWKSIVIYCGITVALILWQPDKGTALTLLLTIWCMLWVSGVQKRLLVLILIVGLGAFFVHAMSDPYSRERFVAMLDPSQDPLGNGYQLNQGFYAFGSGGLFGVGIGMGKQKYSYLPEIHNDFIFAQVGEECGLIGCIVVLTAFAILLWAAIKIAQRAPDYLGSLAVYGCAMVIIIAVLLNVAGVLGIFPMTGKAIPFMSYGGTSMVGSLMLVGVILNVSRQSHLPVTHASKAREHLRVESRHEAHMQQRSQTQHRQYRQQTQYTQETQHTHYTKHTQHTQRRHP